MADLLEGKTLKEARKTLANFSKMLRGETFDEIFLEMPFSKDSESIR
jgi:NifU-like protein involved in Fe-S cluster formation